MNRRVTLIVFVSFLVLATIGTQFMVPVAADPRTIYVDDDNTSGPWDGTKESPYQNINSGIKNALAGDTIHVRAGTYNESITINKDNLTLIGENTIIDGGGAGSVVNVIANNITLSAFTIQNGERGILLWLCSNNLLTNNTVSNNHDGIYLSHSSNNVVSGNTVLNNSYGIYISDSDNNIFSANTVSGNSYGIYVGDSDSNVFSGNTVLNNGYGLYLSRSSYNVLSGNKALNNSDGIYLFEDSSYNNLTDNTVSLNNIDGILLYHSHNNILSSNTVLNNSHGIYVRDSDDNVFSGNVVSDSSYGFYLFYSSGNVFSGITVSSNQYGIYLWGSSGNVFSGITASDSSYGFYLFYSSGNVFSGITVSSNQYGMYFWESGNNIIFHSNFINNVEPVSSIGSANSWNDGVEGNYWSDYGGVDANRDGIGDTPYRIDENNQDNYPLMAVLLQFNVMTENQSYDTDVVSNSTISNFQCHYDVYNRINAVSFKVNGTEGKGFCRICIPHALIKPPYTVTVDYNPPLDFKMVYKNGTHTWLYFTYDHSEREVMIMHTSSPGLVFWSQWAILGLTVTVVILLSISIHYYRMFSKQKKAIQAYERELGSFPVSHSERARASFIKDVIEREEKIEKFKKKYGVKVYPASTLEELMEKLGVQKEKKKS